MYSQQQFLVFAQSDTIEGTEEQDRLIGTNGADNMEGHDKDDIIHGQDGNDRVEGDKGNDRLYGDDGNDLIEGGNKDDLLDGGDGDDTLSGGDGDDSMTGGKGADYFSCGDGDLDRILDYNEAEGDTKAFDCEITTPSTTIEQSPVEQGPNVSVSATPENIDSYVLDGPEDDFRLVYNTFIEPGSLKGTGNYTERKSNVFQPGEEVLLYSQYEGITQKRIADDFGNVQYIINTTGNFTVMDKQGNPIIATYESEPFDTGTSET
jgi:hypothetical protein